MLKRYAVPAMLTGVYALGAMLGTISSASAAESAKGVMIDDVTYVPVRSVSDFFDASANWDEKTQQVTVTDKRTGKRLLLQVEGRIPRFIGEDDPQKRVAKSRPTQPAKPDTDSGFIGEKPVKGSTEAKPASTTDAKPGGEFIGEARPALKKPTPPQTLTNGACAYVQVRSLSDFFGGKVEWDEQKHQVSVTDPKTGKTLIFPVENGNTIVIEKIKPRFIGEKSDNIQ